MKIIGPNHDYYDTVARMGVDELIRYVRVTSEGGEVLAPATMRTYDPAYNKHNPAKCFTSKQYEDQLDRGFKIRSTYNTHLIIFCGKAHFLRLLEVREYNRDSSFVGATYHHLARGVGIDPFLYEHWGDRGYPAPKPKERNRWSVRSWDTDKTSIYDWIDQYDWDAVHRREQAPILEILPFDNDTLQARGITRWYGNKAEHLPTPFRVVRNPVLETYEFQKVIDPYQAFVAIQDYISGVMGQSGNEMVKLSDADLLRKHGFDPKWGFRKPPETA